jgi:formylmethanofuran dehydrogenase subunit E
MWRRYAEGDRSPEVTAAVQNRNTRKMESVLETDDAELFEVKRISVEMPDPARIYKSITCSSCGEKVMETRTRMIDGKELCIPCAENK